MLGLPNGFMLMPVQTRFRYRIHREAHPEDPSARSKSCPTSTFLAAMRFSFQQCGEMNVDLCDVISILASLIDQVSKGDNEYI